jgi:hypothetical protein
LQILLEAIIGCKTSLEKHQSHDYFEYDCCAYHFIAAFNGVIEPQKDGRLHWHIMSYSSVLSQEMLEKAAAASSMTLQIQIGKMLDNFTCTNLSCEIHQWYDDTLSSVQHGSKRSQSADKEVPNASFIFDNFISIWMKKNLLTGMHGHGFCCEKGQKRKIHVSFSIQTKTSFLEHLPSSHYTIQVRKHCKKTNVQAYPVDEETIAMLNASNDALIGEFIYQHPMGPIVWEQTQYEQDAYYCKNNIITTNFVGCANNSSPITSTTSGEAAEEYLSEYMVKEKASLKQAVHSLLVALDQIIVHPSKAEDTVSNI